MRFKSKKMGGLKVFAATCVKTISFGIDATGAAKKGLRIRRRAHRAGRHEDHLGLQGLKATDSQFRPDDVGKTHQHAVQSFVWDDFTAQPDSHYEHKFIPMKVTIGIGKVRKNANAYL